MGAEEPNLRPDHPEEMMFEMEIEVEEEFASSDDEEGSAGEQEGEEGGDNQEKDGENSEGAKFEGQEGPEENVEETESECEDEGDSTDQDFNGHSFLPFDVPLLVPGSPRPDTPAPCGLDDLMFPLSGNPWDGLSCTLEDETDTDETLNSDSWDVRKCFEPSFSLGCYAWPSQVILPQVMVWSREHIPNKTTGAEHLKVGEGKQQNKKSSGRNRAQKKLKRLRKSSHFFSSLLQPQCHHKRNRDPQYLKALREAVHLRQRQKHEANHLKRLAKYFSKAALDVADCATECSCSSSKLDLRRKHRKSAVPRDKSGKVKKANSDSKKPNDDQESSEDQLKNDSNPTKKLQAMYPDPLENWPVWREYFNRTLKI